MFCWQFSMTPARMNLTSQSVQVIDDEYNVFRYRRHGNRLIRNFEKMLEYRDPRMIPGLQKQATSSVSKLHCV